MVDFKPKKEPKEKKPFAGRGYPIEAAGGKQFPSVTTILDVVSKPALVPWATKKERLFVIGVAADLWGKGIAFASREAYIEELLKALGTEAQSKKAMTEAADIGTVVHSACENSLREQMGLEKRAPKQIELNEDQKAAARLAYAAFLEWKLKHRYRAIEIEKRVYSLTHEFAGTMDALGEGALDNFAVFSDLAVSDWKTSAGIYMTACMQVAAYREAYIEMGLHVLTSVVEPELPVLPSLRPLNGLILRLPKTLEDAAILPFEPRFIPEVEMVAYFEGFLAAKALFWSVQNYEAKYPWKRKKPAKKAA